MRMIACILIVLSLASCQMPLRIDPVRQHQQDLEWKQNECLAKGGNPQECRP